MFNKLIGQAALKRKLAFYIAAAKAGETIPALLFEGPKGYGKTEFAKEFSRQLKKPFLEINCATIKNAKFFFEQIFMPVVLGNEITLLFDEAHLLPKDLQDLFLTIFNVEAKVRRKSVQVGESQVEFDFEKQTFLFATTEGDKIFHALKERFKTVDFEPYSLVELEEIMQTKADFVEFEDGLLEQVITCIRGNPRSVVDLALDITKDCNTRNTIKFTEKDWKKLCHTLGIRLYGLTNNEVEVLRVLHTRGGCTLNALAAITGQSRSVLQRDIEFHLMRKNLIRIEGLRKITPQGIKFLATM